MKKSTVLGVVSAVILTSVFSCALAATFTKFSNKFIKNFQDCDKYEETITSEFENKTFTTTRKILGWKNGFCKYEETITSPEDKYQLRCSFSAIQMDELYQAMKSKSKENERYELDMYAEQKNVKNGAPKYAVVGTTTIKGNKAYVTWAKYQNNPYFCTPVKLK